MLAIILASYLMIVLDISIVITAIPRSSRVSGCRFHDVPWIDDGRLLQIEPLGNDFWRVTVHFGS